MQQQDKLKAKYLEELQALRQTLQESPEWKIFKAFLQSQVENLPALGEYRRHYYVHGENPAHVSIRNELFTACKQGVLLSTRLLDDVIAILEGELSN